jgi:hypothetical protein
MSLQRRFTTVRKVLSEATLDFVARQIRLLFKSNDERILLPAVDFAAIFYRLRQSLLQRDPAGMGR